MARNPAAFPRRQPQLGDKAECITDMASLTSVPVEVIAGNAVSPWERYGIPAGLGTLLALLAAMAD